MNFSDLKYFMDNLTKNKVPGNVIRVTIGGKEEYRYASGYSNLESKIPMNGDELLYIYSCSKITTVTAAMQLYEKGEFLLSDNLCEYIPEYQHMYVKDEYGILKKASLPITIGDLFSMTAGLNYNLNSPSVQRASKLTRGKMDTVTVAKCIANEPLSFEPGTQWQYSLCHDVLAALVSVISGKKFRDYVHDNIFAPLEMNETFYHATDDVKSKMANQYSFVSNADYEVIDIVEAQSGENYQNIKSSGTFKNVGLDNTHILGEEYDSGGAGIITSANDYIKIVSALANGGVGMNGEHILSSNTIDLMRTNKLNSSLKRNFTWKQLKGYGYGLGVRTMVDTALGGSNGSVGEFGWGGAAGATVLCDPKFGLAVFYAHHMLNPQEEYYQPRLRNVIYSCI